MSDPVRFLHAADLHLGSALQTAGNGPSRVKEWIHEATYRALSRIVDWALDESVDFVVFSGDIYDRQSRSVRANQFLRDQFRRLTEQDIPVYLVYGNHDPLGKANEYYTMPEGVHIFPADEPGEQPVKQNGRTLARVLGQSYRSRHERRKMYRGFVPSEESALNIGMLHTALRPQSRQYVPCSLDDLQGKDAIDYWALGHRHFLSVHQGSPLAVYPGTPQGRNPNETGTGGCLLVECPEEEVPRLTFLPTSEVIWLRRTVSLDQMDPEPSNLGELEERLLDEAETIAHSSYSEHLPEPVREGSMDYAPVDDLPRGYVVRWVVEGRGDVHNQIEDSPEEGRQELERHLRNSFGGEDPFVWTESIHLRTARPLPNPDELLERDDVFADLLQMLDELSVDDEMRQELINACGKVWESTEDPEDVDEDKLPLTEERFQVFLDSALDRVIDRIIEQRFDHVD